MQSGINSDLEKQLATSPISTVTLPMNPNAWKRGPKRKSKQFGKSAAAAFLLLVSLVLHYDKPKPELHASLARAPQTIHLSQMNLSINFKESFDKISDTLDYVVDTSKHTIEAFTQESYELAKNSIYNLASKIALPQITPNSKPKKIRYTPKRSKSLYKTTGDIYLKQLTKNPCVSSGYGNRIHPITGKKKFHKGIDIVDVLGSLVKAAGSGKVTYAGLANGYGNLVIIRNKKGQDIYYGHLKNIWVKKGQNISNKHVVGRLGNTGNSTAPHLHFEVRENGSPIDPVPYLLSNQNNNTRKNRRIAESRYAQKKQAMLAYNKK